MLAQVDREKLEQVLSQEQIYHLISSLQDNKEIPMKLAYLGEKGSSLWQAFYKATSGTTNYGATDAYEFFLDTQLDFIVKKLALHQGEYRKINLIDLACGTAQHTIAYVKRLDNLGLLGSFIAVDISKEMLQGIEEQFALSPQLQYIDLHTFQHDLDKSEMPKAFMEKFVWDQNRFPSLFLNFGGQISNGDAPQQRAQLLNLASIMTKQDRFLVINAYHQEEEVVTIPSADYDEFYDLYGGWLVELLGITEDVFTYTTDYNEKYRRRSVALKLKKDVKISFDWLGRSISFKERDKITFWRHRREDLPSVQENAEYTGMMVELFATTIQDKVACYMLKKR